MTCFLDSSVLIAFFNHRDGKHARGFELLNDVISRRVFGAPYLCDYVVDEVLTNTYSYSRNKKAVLEFGKYLLSSEFELLFTGQEIFDKSWQLFQKSSGLSFTDCIIASHLEVHGIKTLLSFDSGFDSLRIHRVS